MPARSVGIIHFMFSIQFIIYCTALSLDTLLAAGLREGSILAQCSLYPSSRAPRADVCIQQLALAVDGVWVCLSSLGVF